MANNDGTLVLGPIRPAGQTDIFPSAYSNELNGGWHTVANDTELNAFATTYPDRVLDGMVINVLNSATAGGIRRAYQRSGATWVDYEVAGVQGAQGIIGTSVQGAQGIIGTSVQGAQGVIGESVQGAQGIIGTSVQGAQGTTGSVDPSVLGNRIYTENNIIEDEESITASLDKLDIAEQLKTKVFGLGNWNMNSTESIAITHNLDYYSIRNVSVIIANDGDVEEPNTYSLEYTSGSTYFTPGYWHTNLTGITLHRGGYFDNWHFDDALYKNRGWVTIQYAETYPLHVDAVYTNKSTYTPYEVMTISVNTINNSSSDNRGLYQWNIYESPSTWLYGGSFITDLVSGNSSYTTNLTGMYAPFSGGTTYYAAAKMNSESSWAISSTFTVSPQLSIDQSELYFDNNSDIPCSYSTNIIYVTSNTTWTVSTGASWITYDSYYDVDGEGDGYIIVHVETGGPRTGSTIMVDADGCAQVHCHIYQYGCISVDNSDIHFSSGGTELCPDFSDIVYVTTGGNTWYAEWTTGGIYFNASAMSGWDGDSITFSCVNNPNPEIYPLTDSLKIHLDINPEQYVYVDLYQFGFGYLCT